MVQRMIADLVTVGHQVPQYFDVLGPVEIASNDEQSEQEARIRGKRPDTRERQIVDRMTLGGRAEPVDLHITADFIEIDRDRAQAHRPLISGAGVIGPSKSAAL